MKKIFGIILATVVFSAVLYSITLAQDSNTPSAQELIQKLQQQIAQLKTQIETLKAQIDAVKKAELEVKETSQEIKGTLQLIRQLREGMSGEDVKLLQEILATDKDIYPERKITGYFGPLTAKAVKRLQKKACLDQVGQVGPKTLSRLNEFLTEGAGESGKVPPGLLIAPGIQKRLCGITLKPLPGQILPPGIEKKVTTPSTDGVNPLIW